VERLGAVQNDRAVKFTEVAKRYDGIHTGVERETLPGSRVYNWLIVVY